MTSFQYTTFIIDAMYRILRNLQNLEQDFVTTEVECYQIIRIHNDHFPLTDLLTLRVRNDILELLISEYDNNLLINNRKFECEVSRVRAKLILSNLIDILREVT